MSNSLDLHFSGDINLLSLVVYIVAFYFLWLFIKSLGK